MTIKEMILSDIPKISPGIGNVYRVDLEAPYNDEVYHIPVGHILDIGVNIGEGTTLNLTYSNKDKVVQGTANWVVWDGESDINKCISAFKITGTTGFAEIILRTAN